MSIGRYVAMGIITLFSLEREWKPTTDKRYHINSPSCGRVWIVELDFTLTIYNRRQPLSRTMCPPPCCLESLIFRHQIHDVIGPVLFATSCICICIPSIIDD